MGQTDMKFYPHTQGRQQSYSYETIRDHIVQQVQKTFKYGQDIVQSIRDESYIDFDLKKPTRAVSIAAKDDDKKIEQEGFNMDYQMEMKRWYERAELYEQNKTKAYSTIY